MKSLSDQLENSSCECRKNLNKKLNVSLKKIWFLLVKWRHPSIFYFVFSYKWLSEVNIQKLQSPPHAAHFLFYFLGKTKAWISQNTHILEFFHTTIWWDRALQHSLFTFHVFLSTIAQSKDHVMRGSVLWFMVKWKYSCAIICRVYLHW